MNIKAQKLAQELKSYNIRNITINEDYYPLNEKNWEKNVKALDRRNQFQKQGGTDDEKDKEDEDVERCDFDRNTALIQNCSDIGEFLYILIQRCK